MWGVVLFLPFYLSMPLATKKKDCGSGPKSQGRAMHHFRKTSNPKDTGESGYRGKRKLHDGPQIKRGRMIFLRKDGRAGVEFRG